MSENGRAKDYNECRARDWNEGDRAGKRRRSIEQQCARND